MKADEFDNIFEDEQDITPHLELESARRLNQEAKRVNVDFPLWMVEAVYGKNL